MQKAKKILHKTKIQIILILIKTSPNRMRNRMSKTFHKVNLIKKKKTKRKRIKKIEKIKKRNFKKSNR